MKPRLIAAAFVLVSLPCAYAVFFYGWQLVSFAGFAVRIGDEVPGEAWRLSALSAAQMAVITGALYVMGQGLAQRRLKKASTALAVAWLATAPLLILLLRP